MNVHLQFIINYKKLQIFWLTTLLSTSYTELVVGRFIGGLTGGGILVCMPLFVAEIANKQLVI